ncbi:ParB family protein [Neisseria canis]|uniref:ParB family partitioning protein n=1 Tax=Neisseria canis TaxID=493 RepID=A0A448D9U1_9NEIS|nr:ParB family protein [Neisseria canis]OSI13009.1 hypothetical protein BWD07_02755 [Neisseria canis]VEF02504.1 ParB family partitioning protein [Neisseria canis]
MTNKLNTGVVAASILATNPSQSKMDIGKTPTLPSGFSMTVPVSEIDFFEDNPRHIHDPEIYHQIKESIRATGVQQPVHITKRPDAECYVLAHGGNTRLKIVKELYEETGDSRFAQIPCIYVEYLSESHILFAHVVENELRADMYFWDKACMYAKGKEVLEQEHGETLGLRLLEEKLAEKGIKVSFSKLGSYIFAYEKLSALNDICFYLSIQKTLDLRKQYNSLKKISQVSDIDSEALFEVFWDEALSQWAMDQTDVTDLDVPALQQFINERFAAEFDIKDMGSESKTPPSTPPPQQLSQEKTEPKKTEPKLRPAATSKSENAANSDGLDDDKRNIYSGTDELQSDSVGRQPVDPAGGTIIPGNPTSPRENDTTPDIHSDIRLERTRDAIQEDLITSVRRLLECVNLEKYLIIDPNMPYGFLLGLPNCNQEPLASNFNPEILNGYINCLHPAAGAVYHYLWVISSEEALWDGFQTLPNNHNPFDKPGIQGQLFKENRASEITKEQTFNGILNFAMYKERSQWLFFEFVTTEQAALSAYTDFLRFCAELEANGGDNIDYMEADAN